jgi:hypothetical protein
MRPDRFQLYPLCHKPLKAPKVAVTYALGFEVSDRVEQILDPGAPMTAGPGEDIGNHFERQTAGIEGRGAVHDKGQGRSGGPRRSRP